LLHIKKFNEMIKLHQFLKTRDQIETKKIEDQLDIFEQIFLTKLSLFKFIFCIELYLKYLLIISRQTF